MNRLNKIAYGSLAISLIVLAVKFLAFWLTGSVALYSDALESIVNVGTATAAIIAIRVAAIPPDAEHPYGHHKAEYLSAVLVGVMIVLAAVSILHEAWGAFRNPRPLETPWVGLAVSAGATLLNAIWALTLVRTGKAERSAVLTADGRHLMADVITSAAVLVALGLVVLTGMLVLDPLIAGLVALNVLWSGWQVISENVSGLLDEAAPPSELEKIRQIIALNGANSLEAHALRTRHAGKLTFIDFHLVVDGGTSVSDAHDICDRIENALKAEIPGAVISIHVEPHNKAKHQGIVVLG